MVTYHGTIRGYRSSMQVESSHRETLLAIDAGPRHTLPIEAVALSTVRPLLRKGLVRAHKGAYVLTVNGSDALQTFITEGF